MRAHGRRVLVLLASLAVALLLGEGVFRLFEPRPYRPGSYYTPSGLELPESERMHYLRRSGAGSPPGPSGRLVAGLRVRVGYDRPRWRYFDSLGCITLEHNSLGFREREFPVRKPAGEYRVLALGDSFTYGVGVQAEDAWPRALERLLQKGRQGQVLVINGGFACGTFTPDGYDRWMESDGLQFGPDLVIVGLCLNDMGNMNEVPMLSRPVVDLDLSGPSHLLAYVQRLLAQRAQMREPRPDYAAAVRQHPESWLATQRGLRGLQAILDRASVPLVVAILPMISELDPPEQYPYADLHAMAVAFCREAGIRCVDLQDRLLGLCDQDLWAHPTDQHPNHVGQRLLAEGIHDYLRRERLVP